MNAWSPPLDAPLDDAQPGGAAPSREERQLLMLDRLAEAGLNIALAIERQALAAGEASEPAPAFQGDLSLSFSRAARAVRMTIALQSRLMTGGLQPARAGGASGGGGGVEATLEDLLEQLDAEDAAEQAEREAAERLDDPDPLAEGLDRPPGEIAAQIRRDLGPTRPPLHRHPGQARSAPTRDPGGPCAGESGVPALRFTPAGMTEVAGLPEGEGEWSDHHPSG